MPQGLSLYQASVLYSIGTLILKFRDFYPDPLMQGVKWSEDVVEVNERSGKKSSKSEQDGDQYNLVVMMHSDCMVICPDHLIFISYRI